MAWQAYTLTYRAMAPVLLGTHPLGFIQRTRCYAPGWTLWGAITARLTHARLTRAAGADYAAVGDFVRRNLPTSYAYLLVHGQLATPHYKDGVWHYGPLTESDFEARFITSLGQTGIAPATLSAATGSLHETEALAAHDGLDGQRVQWRLTLYVRQPWEAVPPALAGLCAEEVLAGLADLTLGADRGYGLGWLQRQSLPPPVEAGEGLWPTPLDWPADPMQPVALGAHVAPEQLAGHRVWGRMEAIPWRWWRNDAARDGRWGPGQQQTVGLYYVPGSLVETNGWQPAVGPLGIWQGQEPGHAQDA